MTLLTNTATLAAMEHKEAAKRRILKALHADGMSSRAALAKATGLTKVTVSTQIAELIGRGVVRELGAGQSAMGKKPLMLEVNPDAGYALGLSLSSEYIHALVMDASRGIRGDYTAALSGKSRQDAVSAAKNIALSAARKYKASRYGLFALGLALPGIVNPSDGSVVRSAKLGWKNEAFTADLKKALGKRYGGIIHAGNDATLAAVAEHELYARDSKDFVCLVIDEGIGSGAYINDAPHYGHAGSFGEVGHMTIVHGGKRCPCGNYGCWDLYGSEAALRAALSKIRGGHVPTEDEMIRIAAAFPKNCEKIFNEFADYVASGLVSILNALSPSRVHINSAVLSAAPKLFERLQKNVAERTLRTACDIRLSALGKSAPAMGAALAASELFFAGL